MLTCYILLFAIVCASFDPFCHFFVNFSFSCSSWCRWFEYLFSRSLVCPVHCLIFDFGLFSRSCFYSRFNIECWANLFLTFEFFPTICFHPKHFLTYEIRCCRKVLKNSFNGPKEFFAVKLFTQYNTERNENVTNKWRTTRTTQHECKRINTYVCIKYGYSKGRERERKTGKICKQLTISSL